MKVLLGHYRNLMLEVNQSCQEQHYDKSCFVGNFRFTVLMLEMES